MMLVKGNEKIEAGELPDPSLFVAMEKYNEELKKAGALISLDGLHPSSKGARVWFSGGAISVTDGPFPNPEELVSGFWIIQLPSLKDAIDWAQRVPFKDGVVEVRQIQETEEFPAEIQEAIKKDNL